MDELQSQIALRRAALDAGVREHRVLDAVELVPRTWFVPAQARGRAHEDAPIDIGHEQTTSQPSLVARIMEQLRIEPGSSVLEVGTGFGYEAAIATVLASPGGNVVTVERDARLAAEAHERLARLDELMGGTPWDAQVLVGDGAHGAPDQAPYDAIVVAATCGEVPPALFEQLADGGRLVAPVEGDAGTQLLLFERVGDEVELSAELGWVRYVPLVAGVTGEQQVTQSR